MLFDLPNYEFKIYYNSFIILFAILSVLFFFVGFQIRKKPVVGCGVLFLILLIITAVAYIFTS